MISNERAEETFCPQIDPVSDKLSRRKGREISHGQGQGKGQQQAGKAAAGKSIEDILLAEGERVKEKVEKARLEKAKKEESQLSFKPVMIKAPKHIKPKYRGLSDSTKPPPPLPAESGDVQVNASTVSDSKKKSRTTNSVKSSTSDAKSKYPSSGPTLPGAEPPLLPCESTSQRPSQLVGSLNSDFDEEVSNGFSWKEKRV